MVAAIQGPGLNHVEFCRLHEVGEFSSSNVGHRWQWRMRKARHIFISCKCVILVSIFKVIQFSWLHFAYGGFCTVNFGKRCKTNGIKGKEGSKATFCVEDGHCQWPHGYFLWQRLNFKFLYDLSHIVGLTIG